MASLILILIISSVLSVNLCTSDSLQMGTMTNAQLVRVENVSLSSIIYTSRVKNVFYNDENTPPRPIKAISAIDLDKSNAKPSVTAGGVGFTFVNIKLKSDKGKPLNYQVQIFV